MKRLPLQRLGILAPLLTAVCGVLGCTAAEGDGLGVAPQAASQNLEAVVGASGVIATSYDDSAAPVHVQVKTCKSSAFASVQQVTCRVDPEYAVVGGGATPSSAAGEVQAYLTESRPIDERSWRASSEHMDAQAHELTVFAIGLRLDGVSTRVLRDAIKWKTETSTSSSISLAADSDALLLGGGAMTEPAAGETSHRFLTTIAPSGMSQWNATSRPLAGAAAGNTSVTLLEIDHQVIEGFGALEIMHRSGAARGTAGGVHTTSLQPDTGWAMIGIGGIAETASGPSARMLTSIAPCPDGRCVTVTSGDVGRASSGATIPYLTQIRRAPRSHGLCNPGVALTPTLDGCVTSICSVRSSCCNSSWDSSCVEMVTSVCGRSCAEHTCIKTVLEPSRWLKADGSNLLASCYDYAKNKYPVEGVPTAPGDSLDPDPGYWTLETIASLAAGEGLIPSTFSGECPENRTKVFLSSYSNVYTYHWRRQDADGTWSEKSGDLGAVHLTEDTGYSPYHDVRNHTLEAYFCSCNQALPGD